VSATLEDCTLKEINMGNRFFYSDSHYCHDNIIKYSNRPFINVKDMNNSLIERHNSVVSKSDVSICLGDFSMKGKPGEIEKIVASLNGFKVLIRGNHDSSPKRMYELGFDLVLENMTLHLPDVGRVFFRHFPDREGEDTLKMLKEKHCSHLVHGHVHNNSLKSKQFINVCVEKINYTPISELELIKIILK
jgi:calcineurin-like phosphoesterase family protein